MREFEFDMSFGQLGVAQPPGVEIVSYWHSSNALLPLTRNLSGIQSEAADEMLMRVLNARSQDELIAAGKALDRVLLWNFGMIPLRAVEGPSVIYRDKCGRPPVDAEFRTSFPAVLWYDKAKAAHIPSGQGLTLPVCPLPSGFYCLSSFRENGRNESPVSIRRRINMAADWARGTKLSL